MPNTKSDRYLNIASWIEKVIDSCDHMKMEQEKVCDNLITNLTNQILFITNDVPLSITLDKKLRRKLIKKFYNKPKKQQL
jgi:phosphoribosylaminoimidazole carboxylase (NCAIR synthetase)